LEWGIAEGEVIPFASPCDACSSVGSRGTEQPPAGARENPPFAETGLLLAFAGGEVLQFRRPGFVGTGGLAMDSSGRSVQTTLMVVCLIVAGIAIFAVIGGRTLRQSETSPAYLPPPEQVSGEAAAAEPSGDDREEEPRFVEAREWMVRHDLGGRDITDRKVLEVMGRIPRQRFMKKGDEDQAYEDRARPIKHKQTISQPYIVALMTQLAEPKAESRALDIGTGSGYQAAVLAEIVKEVYSIEILKPLADEARKRLTGLGYKNVTVRHGDGYRGWPEKAPFDVIIVAAAPEHVPQPLVDQLAPGGKLVIPVGRNYQQLIVIEKDAEGTVRRRPNIAVMFVPMTGEAQKRRE